MHPDLNLLGALIGELSIDPHIDFSRKAQSSPGAGSKLKNSTQYNQFNLFVVGNGEVIEKTIDSAFLAQKKGSPTFKEGYRAVFLSTNQVYFGKLEFVQDRSFVKLRDIFYLYQPNDRPVDINLVKLGQELHGPEDEMHINKDHVVFWEKIRDDSTLVTAIVDFHQRIQS